MGPERLAKGHAMHRSSISRKRLTGAAAITCASALAVTGALAAAASPAGAERAARAASGTPCATSGLVIWLDTMGSGTAGSIYYHLEFTNLSGHSCTLLGYPGVSAVKLGGHQLGRPASRNNTAKPATVTLASGATATAVLQIVDVNNFPASRCHPVTAAGLRVYPPNQTASAVVPFPFGACSSSTTGFLTVQAIRKS